MILYAQPLYAQLATWLRVFDRDHPFGQMAGESQQGSSRSVEAVVFGLGRYGSRLLEQLRAGVAAAVVFA